MYNRFYLLIFVFILFVACGAEEEKTNPGPATGSNIELDISIETLGADLTRVGYGISIALVQSNPVICHFDSDNYKILLKTQGSSWSSEEVADVSSLSLITSTAVDSSGKVHIVYSSENSATYITNASGTWVSENFDSDSLAAKSYASICVDDNDDLHVSYYDVTNTSLKYSTNSSGAWVSTVLDDTGDCGKLSGIKLDADGKGHIFYLNEDSDSIKHITNKSGTWQSETVATGLAGLFDERIFSFDFDTNCFLHVSYFDIANDDLKYATNKTGSWVVQTIDSYGWVGRYNKIAVDSSDKIHICYHEQNQGYLKYATNKNGVWQFATIDNPDGASTSTGFGSDMIIDSDDNLHLAYQLYYETGGYNYRNLKYAKITFAK